MPIFDDASWRQLDVPHDWSIEGGEVSERQHLPILNIVEGKWQFHRGDNPEWKKPDAQSRRLGDRPIAELVERSLRLQRRALLRLVSPHDRDSPRTCRARRSSSISARSTIATKHSSTARRSAPRATCRRTMPRPGKRTRLYKLDPKLVHDGENVVAVRVYNGESKGGMYDAGATTIKCEGPFDPLSPAGDGGGYLNGGIGWYRKTFATPAGGQRPPRLDRVRRRLHGQRRLAQRQAPGPASLRLHEFLLRPDRRARSPTARTSWPCG